MPLTKAIKLAGKTVTVRELTVQEIHNLATGGKTNPPGAVAALLTAGASISMQEIMESAPSDLSPLVEAMLEVNAPFLDHLRSVELPAAAEGLERVIRSVLIMPFLPSSEPATAAESGIIPGLSSSPR